MWTINFRLGIPEMVMAAGLVFLAVLVALFIIEWPVGLVPAASYALATLGTYGAYRLYAREREQAAAQPATETEVQRQVVRFRVVDTLGACPLGRRTGDVIALSPGQPLAPPLCPEAEAVLRMAAANGQDVKQWCCPVYDHMLVLKKVTTAA